MVFLWVLILLSLPARTTGAERFPEYQVKAELLLRLAEFVDWPAETFSDPGAPFIIGIIGKNPFGTYLERLITREKIKDHRIVLRPFQASDSPDCCHLLFISRTATSQADRILAHLSHHPVLSISDVTSLTRKGSHIGFQIIEGRVRFNINLRSARQCGLVISTQLLRLANRIYNGETP